MLCHRVAVELFPRAIPRSALNEGDDEEDDDDYGESRDDERSGTRYNVRPLEHRSGSSDTLSVFLVPYHLCTWRHVRGDAAHRLV